jgi:plasmid stability protein
MSDKVTIELPDELARRARAMAAAGHRRLEDAVVEWIRRAVSEPEVEALPDNEVLRLCDATLEPTDQDEFTGLLADSREGRLDAAGHARLDELMAFYRRGLVLKARAWREAVTRGLRTPPNDADHAA